MSKEWFVLIYLLLITACSKTVIVNAYIETVVVETNIVMDK